MKIINISIIQTDFDLISIDNSNIYWKKIQFPGLHNIEPKSRPRFPLISTNDRNSLHNSVNSSESNYFIDNLLLFASDIDNDYDDNSDNDDGNDVWCVICNVEKLFIPSNFINLTEIQ